jgi:hypothetical protein
MAAYYSLITRAVAALDKNNGESRRALYEHARTALLAQLRSTEPALNESDITRERLALEDSIRKVETESARKFIETPDFDRPQRPRDRDRVQHDVRDRARDGGRGRAQAAMPFDRSEMLGSRGPTEHVPVKARRASPAAEDAPYYRSSAQAQQWLAWRPSRGLIMALGEAAVGLALMGVLAWQWPKMVELYRMMRAPAVETAREALPSSVSRPNVTDRIEPGSQSSMAFTPPVEAGADVTQKVVLYEEDPADPNGKRSVGSAIWRTETVTPSPGQAPELAVRADVEVPERKLVMTWSLHRNVDKTLPASHTVEIVFKLPADFSAGGISNVPGILMKQAEQTRGVPLSGLAVKVTNGFFLIGLSSVEADKVRNLQLLKDGAWFDIPVVYNNNRRAILAMEKGTPGERAFAEAFKVW